MGFQEIYANLELLDDIPILLAEQNLPIWRVGKNELKSKFMGPAFFIEPPPDFSFRHTVFSHGWSDLQPFALNEQKLTLSYVLATADGKVLKMAVSESDGRLKVQTDESANKDEVKRAVTHMLRLDQSLTDFYVLASKQNTLRWAVSSSVGRLLRSQTVFEDLMKTICTTNCSWGLTKKMVSNLVESLGPTASDGSRAFPTPETMAAQPASFYRDEMRAGYRSPYFAELADSVAAGRIDPESWLRSELPTRELKNEIKKIKGIGDYAAENLLKLLGRYDGLALDSWLRAGFYEKHNGGRKCPDKKIERHYGKFGEWKGLAIWCDMTERWFEAKF